MLRNGKMYNSTSETRNKMSFEDWKLKVDDIVFSKLNLNCSDLPDEDYWMSWDKDFSPEKMANIVISNANSMAEHFFNIIRDEN